MIDYLNAIGDWSWGAVWLPVLAWTVLGAAVLLALRLVPGAYLRLHRDLRFALLLALPLGLLLGTVVPEFVGPAVIVPPVEGTLTDAGGSATALQVSDVGSRLSAATGLGVFSLAALLAAIGGLFLLAISAWRLRQIVGGAYPYAGLAPDLPANVSILVSDQISVPISSGLFRRVIVLPRENPADCRLAILHELTHHRQGDIARVFVTRGIGALFVAHPLVHGLMTRLDLLMEMICDQLVLSRSESDPARYASLLLSYVPSVGTSKLMPALFMGRSHQELVRRIASMKTRQRGSSLLSLGAAALLFAAASGVVGCAQADQQSDAAQGYEISGIVTDAETGEPLAGANVLVEGGEYGSVTDDDGIYTLRSIPPGAYELKIRHRGREVRREKITVPAESPAIPAGSSAPMYIVDGVIWTGGQPDIEALDIESIEVLKGAAALSLYGARGQNGVIQITTKDGGNLEVSDFVEVEVSAPIYIVDGVVVSVGQSAIEALDIEYIEVLKGAAALSLYGARGQNGVIHITTKRGGNLEVSDLVEDEVFVVVEEMPELVGGLEAIQKQIRYPEIAKKAGVQGRVIIQFIVDETGRVTDPRVVRGIGSGADEEAIRAVQAAKFLPGRQRGRAVKVQMTMPVTFRLSN